MRASCGSTEVQLAAFLLISCVPARNPPDLVTKKITALTPKERTIVSTFASEAGASNKKIAHKLCISDKPCAII